ncbi:MAG: DNA repair protein RecN [Oscillospiraceae bacterium]|nr:DNA repair protein RecN [Oscillospiraceae bacterium]
MLSLLHIENIAVIECADISFDAGFNVLTGETGAGKSIVIDAISAILGERTYRDMIRTGTDKATVRAVFTDVPELPWFEENGVPYDAETVIHRDVFLDGKNICRVNGTLVTVSILRKLGIQLINIHGQHDSASLFDEANHLVFLDDFAENSDLRGEYAAAFDAMIRIRREIQRMSMDEGEKIRKMETLRYQIEEISKANLEPDEDEQLEERRKILQNGEKLSDAMNAAAVSLYGDDDTDGAASLLAEAERELSRLNRYTDAYSALHERVADLMYQVQDVAEEIRDARDDLSFSADELDKIEARLDVIHRLRRKYGATCRDILAYLENAQKELDEIEFADDTIDRLKKKLAKAEADTMEIALRLRENRKQTAEILSARILSELAQLDMPKVQFSCAFQEIEMAANGADAVAFYMSANAGEALKPLNKVASGGELARIMLAMKNVLAEQDQVATLIFDEVDTGVSGRAAQKVAEKLRSVAKNKQVLCVTHLPQLAALASTHLLIAKEERGGRTYTTVTPLDVEGRKRELARIIGGANITETTLKSAGEMLADAT